MTAVFSRRGFLTILTVLVFFAPSAFSQTRPDALVLYRQGSYEQAVEVTLQELRDNPSNLDSYIVLGWSLLELRRFAQTLEYAQQALRVSRFDHRVLHIISEAHYGLGNYLQALQFLQEYATIAPDGRYIAQVYYLMGEVFLRFEEYHHADIALTKAVYHLATPANWWMRLGFAREMAGAIPLARAAYEQALQRNPNLLDARRALDRLQG